ncbi:hypothetical protein CAL7716_072270 [Calothrix sp. PCC 7716]|nr:hypothetical protein CAL7716_072270 [Calothrix sp. PCC 7716]
MAECKDIDKALQELGGKIDGFNDRLKNLDDRLKKAEKCCNNKTKQEEGKGDDLTDILRRLAKLEDVVNKIAAYIESLENAIKAAITPLKVLVSLFNVF